jgi:hypothetical protein
MIQSPVFHDYHPSEIINVDDDDSEESRFNDLVISDSAVDVDYAAFQKLGLIVA